MSFAQLSNTTFGVPQREAVRRSESPTSHALLQVVDAGLWSSIFIVPCFFGGRHDLGRFVLILIAAVTAVAWCARQAIRERATWVGTYGYAVALAACALLVAQLVPLPESLFQWLSPRTGILLPLWSSTEAGEVGLGRWESLSLQPAATRMALALLVAYGLLFFTCVGRIRSGADAQRLLRWIGIAGVAMAAFALVQYFTANGRYFWFYELPFRTTADEIKGTFTTRNHFAHYLVLAAGPLTAWLVTSQRQQESEAAQQRRALAPSTDYRTLGLATGLALVAFCALLSRSRGGAVALFVAVAVLSLVYYRHRLVTGKHLMTALGVGAAVVALLSVYGYDKVSDRLDDFQEVLSEGSLDALDQANGRRTIWAANVQAIRAGWLTGSGAGTHREIYPVYLSQWWPREFTHAESGYLQVATETGIAGALLLMCGMALCFRWCWRAVSKSNVTQSVIWSAAAAAGLAASIAQSLVDFVWYIPGCMTVTVMLAACALRYSQFAQEEHETQTKSQGSSTSTPRISRQRWLEMAVGVALTGGWAVATMARPAVASLHWDRYLAASVANTNVDDAPPAVSGFALQGQHAGDDSSLRSSAALLRGIMIDELEQVVRIHPGSARAHLRLARCYLRQFEQIQGAGQNPMSITQIREAAIASQFASPEDLQIWLNRAFGESAELLARARRHALLAVRLCPLQGEGYLYLANLCFLSGEGAKRAEAYVSQALTVRPLDGDVLFAAGIQHSATGNLEAALRYWAESFRVPGDHQLRIIDVLPSTLPARTFLEEFEPDWHSLDYLWGKYQALGTPQDLADVATYAAQVAARDGEQTTRAGAARNWVSVAGMYRAIGAPEQALAALRHAYSLAPHIYKVRLELGNALFEQGQYAEAEVHWRWCVARRPGNAHLRNLMLQASRARLGAESEPRAGGDTSAADGTSVLGGSPGGGLTRPY